MRIVRRKGRDSQKRYPRCSGCGGHDHPPDDVTLCPWWPGPHPHDDGRDLSEVTDGTE